MPAKGCRTNPVTRFWRFVDRKGADECWEWTGCRNRKGYGRFKADPSKNAVSAHRYVWVITRGPIPGGLHVLHTCDNPSCVNLRHLYLGTNWQNVRDRDARGRTASGEKAGRSKLTREAVRAIRSCYRRGLATQQELADAYGVGRSTVRAVIHRRTWTHLCGAET